MPFTLSTKDRNLIAETFNVKEKIVTILAEDFESTVKERISREFLSHVVSALEKMAREITGNKLFIIELKPLADGYNVFSSKYSPRRFFTVYYPEDMEPKQKRVGIAHELGHLYVLLLLKLSDVLGGDENLCSIFSILTIADRCQFYKKDSSAYTHVSVEDIISTMSLLHNRTIGKVNVSE
ncbi:MAG: hypothetical protein CSA76_04650 [Spirochaetales bacterium]|nr:MAG: hypothetical protein CSA76_04650 [Spirochaetales bacterium]